MPLSSLPSRNAPVSSERLSFAPVYCMLISSAVSTPQLHNKEPAVDWHAQDFQEFVPQTFESQMVCADVSYSPNVHCNSQAKHRSIPAALLAMTPSIHPPLFLPSLAATTKPLRLTPTARKLQQLTIKTMPSRQPQHTTCTGL